MNNQIKELKEKTISNALTGIWHTYSYTKEVLETINFNSLKKEDLISYLNNCNGKFLDTSTGKFIDKLPNENYPKEVLINMCESQNIKMIEKNMINVLNIIGQIIEDVKEDRLVKTILEETSKSNNDKVRLKCALVSPNYISFLNDTKEEIKEVAHVKSEYYHDILNYSEEEINLIKCLGESINSDLIEFVECPIDMDYDSKKRNVSSHYFNEENIKIDYILTELADKKIVANLIYKLLLESKLTFNEGFEPSYWNTILSQNGLEKVIVYKKINN